MAISNSLTVPRQTQTSSITLSLAAGTPVENDTEDTIVVPIQAQNITPIAVVSATTTSSPKVVTLASPSSANIRAGSIISGGSFAGTEVVAVVTKNSAGKVTSFTYTGTGSVNASPVDMTVTDTEYDPTLYYIKLKHSGSGSSLSITAEILPLPGASSSESAGAEAGTIASATSVGASASASINVAAWREALGFTSPV
jgi:hypothetical protein